MKHDPNHGDGGESRLRRIRVGGEGAKDETRDDARTHEAFGVSDGPRTMGAQGMSAADERTWSVLSHLSILLSLITGIGGIVGALVIWLVYKDRSERVAFHALQSLWYQVAWTVILAVGWTITAILSLVVIGLLLVPVMLIATLVPIAHQCYAAYKVNQGIDYRYPFIADVVDRNHRFG